MDYKSNSKEETVKSDVVEDFFVIGILVSKSNRKLKESLNKLSDLGRVYTKGKVAAFSLEGINRDKQMITGYLYKEGMWNPSTFLMPDAIINRIYLNRKWESFFRKTIGIKMINNFTFNKWEMYKWLSTNPNLSKHLPITQLVNSPQDIIDFLGQHNEGIIKPINGSYGKGIFKVSKHAENFKVDTSLLQKNKKNSLYLTQEELEVFFKTKCKMRKYIIQQVIDLYVGNSPVDFRLIMVKDGTEEWKELGIIARKGSQNGIVSNIGFVRSGSLAFQNLLSISDYKAIEIRKKMTQVSLDAAKEMENYRGCNGNLGNLGIDLGLDKNQHLWIIEINHRNPGHRMAVDAGEYEIYSNSNKLIMDYAHKLAERMKESCI